MLLGIFFGEVVVVENVEDGGEVSNSGLGWKKQATTQV